MEWLATVQGRGLVGIADREQELAGRCDGRIVVDHLRCAEQNGLQPGTSLQVVDRNLTAGLVSLRRNSGRPLVLSVVAAGKILVEPEK